MEIAFRYNRTCIRYLAPFLNSFFSPNVHTINLSTGVPGDTLSLRQPVHYTFSELVNQTKEKYDNYST